MKDVTSALGQKNEREFKKMDVIFHESKYVYKVLVGLILIYEILLAI